jgi:S-formylglutathione hydrolase
VKQSPTKAHILIDQGAADNFLDKQLRPQLFADACAQAGQEVSIRMREGYDHSYYFVASFIGEHMAHHASKLNF